MVTNRLTDEAVAREKISQWMDGEADEEDANSAYAALRNETARDTWALYHYIGDTLRDGAQSGAEILSAGFTGRVMQALADEPVIQIPEAVVPPCEAVSCGVKPQCCTWTLAAMAAGVAVVGVLVLTFHRDIETPATVASETAVVVAAASPTAMPPVGESALSGAQTSEASIPLDYLITYQEFLPSASLWPGINVYQWTGDVITSPCRAGRR